MADLVNTCRTIWFGAGAVALVAMISITQPAVAADEEPVNTGYFGDVAIRGYDPVAYFTESKAVEGTKKFTYRWLGATWQFANADIAISSRRIRSNTPRNMAAIALMAFPSER